MKILENPALNAQYAYRWACDSTKQDLLILDIDYSPGCGPYNNEEIYTVALEWLLQNNPMGFIPSEPDTGCSLTWRLGIISCWRNSIYSPHPPCPDSACCWQVMKVCRDLDNNVTYEPNGPTLMYEPYLGCDTLPGGQIPPPDDSCYHVCSWLGKSGSISPQQGEVYFPLDVIDSSSENSKFTVQYFDGFLNVYLKSKCGEHFKIDVSDVYGIKWISSEQLSRTEKLNFKIDIHTLGKGYYIFKIFCNENYIGNGKFIVE